MDSLDEASPIPFKRKATQAKATARLVVSEGDGGSWSPTFVVCRLFHKPYLSVRQT